MPRPTLRLPRAAGPIALATACVLLTGCGTDEDDASAAPTVSTTTAPPSASVAPPSPTPSPDDAQVVDVTVAGGEVTGAEPRTQVEVGTKVRLTITSDVADEVHVHGYDLTERLTVGQAVSVEFVADQPGIFEVELHDAGTILTRLQVQ